MQMWSDELANIALSYSEKCVFQPNKDTSKQSPSFIMVGENQAPQKVTNPVTFWGEKDLENIMSDWYAEGACRVSV